MKIHLWRARRCHPVPRVFDEVKVGVCLRWILLQLEIEASDIKPGQVHTIVDTVTINIFREVLTLPFVKMAIEHQIELEVNMGSLPIDSLSGMTHNRQRSVLSHLVSRFHHDNAEMGVKAVVRTVVE